MKTKLLAKMLMVALVTGSLTGCGSTAKDTTVQTETSVETNGTTETTEESNENAELTEEEIAAKEAEEAAAKEAEKAAAKEAEANEYYEAGRASLYGLDGTEVNLETAYNNFEKAKELDKIEANFYLGVLCDWYNYPEMNYEMAKNYYEECGDNPYAQISLGYLYLYGQGVEEDKEKAKEIFQTVVDNGCMDGYCGYALIAEDEQQYDIAFEYANKVVEEGNEELYIACAMNRIGNWYRDGNGVEQDYAKALEWYEKALDLSNYSSAMNNIAELYYYGNGVEQDYEKALEGYEKAIDLGNSVAMNNLGVMYYYGNGVEQDYEKALEWFDKAASFGQDIAKENAEYLRQELAQ